MANIAQADTNYAGKDAGKLIGENLLKGDSLSQDIFTIRQGNKGESVIRRFEVGTDALQGALCDFNAVGGKAINKPVSLTVHNVNIQACKDVDFNFDWTAFDMADGVDGTLNADAAKAIADTILHRVAVAVDQEIWINMITEAQADTDVVDVVLATTTVDNILEEIGKVYSQMAVSMDNIYNAVIVVSNQDKALYEQALAKNGAMPQFYLDQKGTNYLGVRIVGVVGMPNSTMVGADKENLFFITDLDSDRTNVTVKDMGETDLSNNIRFKAHWSQVASYANPKEFILGIKA